jgi:acetyl-CoA carboxylase / biotin carboxylase 1
MILANWRGFSGGQRDMYNEVLKYGSFIVDALVKYEQPIFIYIPPFGELRGGSWVVVDPTIAPDTMEMYADDEARGGVLEPEGMIGIKYRKDKQLQTMVRMDPTYAELKKQLSDKSLNQEVAEQLKTKMLAREKELLPVYAQIAVQFADLHDRAGRMKAKGVIREQLQWTNARRFFYWRLRRRLNEEYLLKRMSTSALASPSHQSTAKTSELRKHNLHILQTWSGIVDWEKNDKAVTEWYEKERKAIAEKLDVLKAEKLSSEVATLVRNNQKAGWKGVREVLRVMPVEERDELLKYLKN